MSEQVPTKDQSIPPAPTARVAWLYKHGAEIVGLRVDYVMLTSDTSKTVWHLELSDGHKETVDETELSGLLCFYPHHDVPSHRALAILKRELQEQCRTRAEWEKKNNRELAEYKRLKAKFEGTP
jgi:hypothetical protein